jgi:hypothetical protein
VRFWACVEQPEADNIERRLGVDGGVGMRVCGNSGGWGDYYLVL